MNLKKSLFLFLVIQFTKIIYNLHMDDVCSADDDKCKKPNLSGVGMIEKGKCSLTGVLLRFHQMSLLECAKKCLITSNCTSINYRHNWKLCDLVMSDDGGNEIADDSNCIRSNITTWQKLLAGKCADHDCEEGKQCEINPLDNSVKCVAAYFTGPVNRNVRFQEYPPKPTGGTQDCKGLPNTPHAAVDERFGLRRNLDTGNKYKCDKDYKMKGNPFAVCQSPGNWKVLFSCTTKVECSAEGYKYDAVTHIKLETPQMKWNEAMKYCQEQGGYLVSITRQQKLDSIISYLKGCAVRYENIWIGTIDTLWLTGGQFITDQLRDQLNDITVQSNGKKSKQSCNLINTQQNRLEDENCNKKYKFLCEKTIV